eukprot:CAMPEP_0117046392 /NCGR_PEP_ID=MMETSP0472-20121206/32082_1 /TAXON_ID=693140 ORGANISM="Tiarina fusus, Strain LIS" /NCGR_SAMPLE_ID=MMETSP0472 /ASSEMBLY_ACC=CAM_ASM_000603 /LENGTH=176 /DNA_ID=CAMNT_0004758735 /DNA_START=12 /DNA_END=542 /DNA_ORIENTATION=+
MLRLFTRTPAARALPGVATRFFGGSRVLRDEAAAGAIPSHMEFSLLTPHEPIMNSEPVHMAIIPGSDGIFGVLAGHVPTVTRLRPGTLSIYSDETNATHWFVSSGFAVVHPDSRVDIQAIEAVKVDDLDQSIVSAKLTSFNRDLETAQSEEDKAAASIGVECFTAMQASIEQYASK